MQRINNIFLHFLDREACVYSRSYHLPIQKFVEVFQVVCAVSHESLYLSGGHLFEHKAARILYQRYALLFLTNQIRPVGSARDVESFVASKAEQYAHARRWIGRDYSIYFGDAWKRLVPGPVAFVTPTIDTSVELAKLLIGKIGFATDSAKRTVELVEHRAKSAITVALLQGKHQSIEPLLDQYSQWISKYYQLIYRNKYASWIFADTGLISQSLEEGVGLEHSYPVYRYVYNSVGLNRMYSTQGFHLQQFRGSIEHIRFVTEIRRRFAMVGIDEIWKIGITLGRLFHRSEIGPHVRRSIETVCCAITDSLTALGELPFEDLFGLVSSAKPFTVPELPGGEPAKRIAALSESEKEMRAFVVVAAPQELRYVREYLRKRGIRMEKNVSIANRSGTYFYIATSDGKEMRVGLVLAVAKGGAEMNELLEALLSYENPDLVILVGMMAGIKDKVRLLDVIIPRTIFDGTAIGTRDGSLVAEPEAADVDRRLHQWLLSHDWNSERYTKGLTIVLSKKSVTVSAKMDDISHELTQAALSMDTENIVGLEMEGYVLAHRQKAQRLQQRDVSYLMIKGVADFAGIKADANDCAHLPAHLRKVSTTNPDPIRNVGLRSGLQKEATARAMSVALILLAHVSFSFHRP